MSKLKITKREIRTNINGIMDVIAIGLLFMIFPYLHACTMTNEDHINWAKSRLKPILEIGTPEYRIKEYLDKKKYIYVEITENYCGKELYQLEKYKSYQAGGGTQDCANIQFISVHFRPRYTMIDGTVFVALYLSKDKKLEVIETRIGWSFL